WNTSFLERGGPVCFFLQLRLPAPEGAVKFFDMLSRNCGGKSPPFGGAAPRRRVPLRGVQVKKGARGMPRLPEAMKDAASCENPRGPAHTGRSAGVRMGQPSRREPGIPHSCGRRTRGTETSKYP